MSRKLIWLVLLLSMFVISGCTERAKDLEQVSANKRIVIRFSHVVAESTPKGLAAKRFAYLVHQRTGGRVEVQVYPNSTLYKDGEEFKALTENNVQMIAPATAKLTDIFPQWQIFDLPFLFENYAEVHNAMDGEVGQKLFDVLEEKNVKGLAMWDNGFKQMSANQPLHTVEDFRGLSFRIMPSKMLARQFQRLGANVKELPFSEVYRALQWGEVNGAENPLSNFYTKKFHQVQSDVTISNHGYLGYAVMTNKTFWNSLPEDIRKIIKDTLEEVTMWERKEAQRQNQQFLTRLENTKDITIHHLTQQEKLQWKAALYPLRQEFTPEIGEELLESIIRE
ncbi:TRAP transporter substrate-binding protein [Metallumcola ferriviriculae]|uniref:TRAP transporter substrate-binding protein n=1 Tax=Metallumcola ferriviriculae TaxID=3039180 RepID=A0AAU0UJA0_9FIRM|nr:TRAP transporter substrate-binding protein [Desulfitibacteraceae bacterium MK1]